MHRKFLLEKVKRKDNLGDLDVDGSLLNRESSYVASLDELLPAHESPAVKLRAMLSF
jgi:hypothetical protein